MDPAWTCHPPPHRLWNMVQSFRSLVACVAWPALLAGCVATTAIGFSTGWPVLGFNLTYLALAASLLLLERWMPHEAAWQPHDGQFRLDLGHTMVSNGTIQALLVLSGVIGLSALLARLGHSGLGLWPHQWPLAPQVALGLAVSEFAAYWAHRTAHEWEPLWYFHAIHHSVEKLWCVNSGRFHFVDALKSVVPGVLILVLAGAPAEVMAWLSALTGYIGIMTHTNVAMRFGPLNYVFNTPALHRWHHSMDLREGQQELRREPGDLGPRFRHLFQRRASPSRDDRHRRSAAGRPRRSAPLAIPSLGASARARADCGTSSPRLDRQRRACPARHRRSAAERNFGDTRSLTVRSKTGGPI